MVSPGDNSSNIENFPCSKTPQQLYAAFRVLKFALIRHVYLPIPARLHFYSVHAYHTCEENASGEFAMETIVVSRQRSPQMSAIGMRSAGEYPAPCYLQKTTRVRDETLAYPKNATAVPGSLATILVQMCMCSSSSGAFGSSSCSFAAFGTTNLCFLRVCTTPYRPGGK